jgi:esterase/lipase superfamily enzyme
MDGDWLERLRKVEWVVATGEQDSLVAQNRAFADLLARKGQRVTGEFWPGVFGHDWPFWKEHIRRFV